MSGTGSSGGWIVDPSPSFRLISENNLQFTESGSSVRFGEQIAPCEGAYAFQLDDIISRVLLFDKDFINTSVPVVWNRYHTMLSAAYNHSPVLDSLVLSTAIKVAASGRHPARATSFVSGLSIPHPNARVGDIQYHLFPRYSFDENSEHLQVINRIYRNGRFAPKPDYMNRNDPPHDPDTLTGSLQISDHFLHRLKERLVEEGSGHNLDDFETALVSWVDGPKSIERLRRSVLFESLPNAILSSTFRFTLPQMPEFKLFGGMFTSQSSWNIDPNLITCFNVSASRIANHIAYVDEVYGRFVYEDSWLGMLTPNWVTTVRGDDSRLWIAGEGASDALCLPDPDMLYASCCPLEHHVTQLLSAGGMVETDLVVMCVVSYLRMLAKMIRSDYKSILYSFLMTNVVRKVAINNVVTMDLLSKSTGERVHARMRLLIRLALSQYFQLGFHSESGVVHPSVTPRYAVMRLVVPGKVALDDIEASFAPSPLVLIAFKHFAPILKSLSGANLINMIQAGNQLRDVNHLARLTRMRETSIRFPRMRYSDVGNGSSGRQCTVSYRMSGGMQAFRKWLISHTAPNGGGADESFGLDSSGRPAVVFFLHMCNLSLFSCYDYVSNGNPPRRALGARILDYVNSDVPWDPVTSGCVILRDKFNHVSILFPKPQSLFSESERKNAIDPSVDIYLRLPFLLLSTPFYPSSVIGDDYKFTSSYLPTIDSNFMSSLPSAMNYSDEFYSSSAPTVSVEG